MNKDEQGDRLTPVAQRSHNAEKGKVGTCPKGHLTQAMRCFMKRVLLLLAVVAVLVLLFAPVATAQYYGGGMASPAATATATASPTVTATATASPTTTATASPTATVTATALPPSGGPPLMLPVTLAASLALMASGVGQQRLVARPLLTPVNAHARETLRTSENAYF